MSWNATKIVLRLFVHVHHRIKQHIDDEMRAVILHAVERGTVCLDTVQHAVNDPGDVLLKLFDPSPRQRFVPAALPRGPPVNTEGSGTV